MHLSSRGISRSRARKELEHRPRALGERAGPGAKGGWARHDSPKMQTLF